MAGRERGWDKRAVNRIAEEQYGSLAEMFRLHGWNKLDRTFGQIAPSHVKATYGSVAAFEQAHENGLAGNALVDPVAAINSDPPNVWLTSYYGYDPENWGLLAFGSDSDRAKFLRESEPGALVVVYGTKSLRSDMAGRILGVQQVSHLAGPSEQFISPQAWAEKQASPRDRGRWLFGVQSTRAWHVVPEDRPRVEDFADETWSAGAGRSIGRYCKRLTCAEARKVLDLQMYEGPVFGGREIEHAEFADGQDLMRPSRPGPVSQSGFHVSESEGPKHLYMLELVGDDIGSFVRGPIRKRRIVKVGFSKSPEVRCKSFNSALPGKQFEWRILKSTFVEGLPPFPTSHHAKSGEQEMVRFLHKKADSMGGEFFLANDDHLNRAWKRGKSAATEFGG